MKKFISLILVLVMVVSFCACGSKTTNSPSSADPEKSPETNAPESSSSAPEKVTLEFNLGIGAAATNPVVTVAEEMAATIYERTDGQIKITVYSG